MGSQIAFCGFLMFVFGFSMAFKEVQSEGIDVDRIRMIAINVLSGLFLMTVGMVL